MQDLLCTILRLATFVVIGWIVLSYVVTFGRLGWDHPVRKFYSALTRVVDPVLKPIRGMLPPVRLGGAALDLSPLVLIVGIQILLIFICR